MEKMMHVVLEKCAPWKKTMVIIAHRLTTIDGCDVVYIVFRACMCIMKQGLRIISGCPDSIKLR